MTPKEWWRVVRPYVIATPIYAMARFIGMTTRFETVGSETVPGWEKGVIYAGWHGRTLLGASYWRKRGYYVLVSQSKDGDMQAKIFRRFGFRLIRGSTGRGGMEAAVESIRVLKKGGTLAFTPDGPRGPSGVVQEGVMLMARKSGAPIVPSAVSAKRRFHVKSWDRYMVPFPFNHAVIVFGEPVWVPKDATEAEVETLRQTLQARIHEAERLADARFGHVNR